MSSDGASTRSWCSGRPPKSATLPRLRAATSSTRLSSSSRASGNKLPKVVFSKTLEEVEGNTRLSRADPVQTVRELKEENGGPIGVGGAELAATLTEHGLIDEYRLFVHPVALGGGRPFFAGDSRVDLELLETRTFGNRVVYLRYRRP
jgi:dihydrofolate reductase